MHPTPRRFRPPVLALGAACMLVALTCGPQLSTPQDGSPGLPFLAPAPAQAGPSLTGNLTVLSDVAEAVLPAVVNISSTRVSKGATGPFHDDPFFRRFFGERGGEAPERRSLSRGSGVLVGEDGLVLTNNHVVSDAEEVTVVLSDGRKFTAEVIGTDPRTDLAVIRLEDAPADLVTLKLGSSQAMRLGEVVLAVGNPFGLEGTVTMGIVSAKGRTNVGIVEYEDFIQTDAAINPGNSGGALVNLAGELVGINTAIASRSGGYQGIGFAIPSDMARPIMESLLATGKVERAWLGVLIQNIDPDMVAALQVPDTQGVLVGDVPDGSPANKAGIKHGDVITGFDGKAVTSTNELRHRVALELAGKTVKVELLRDGKRKVIPVVLGAMPEPGQVGQAPDEAPDATEALAGLEVAPLDRSTRARYDVPNDVTRGLVVTRVEPGSEASRAGVQPGDVILEVNRKRVDSVESFARAQGDAPKSLLLISRGGSSHYLMLG